MQIPTKSRYFWPLLLVVCLADCTTKDLVVERLDQPHVPYVVLDQYVRFTLVHNDGAAFGIDVKRWLGPWARPVLIGAMLAVLAVLLREYRRASPKAKLAAIGLGLASGGAIGNLYDRFRSPLGVVDFIDVGVGQYRFWVFNIADAGIFVGAVLFAIVLWRESPADQGDAATAESAAA